MPSGLRKKPIRKPIFLLILVGALAYGAYSFMAAQRTPAGKPGGAPSVGVAEVIERDIQQWTDFSGRLMAVNQVDIRPRVSGPIESIYFHDGSLVHKSDPLFLIDPRPYEAALEAAQARATFTLSEFRRAQKLMAEKAIPQHEYDQRKNDAEVAQADLTTARLNLGYTQIHAPISGKIGRAEITLGNLVEAGGNAPILTTLVSIDPIYADFDVDEDTFLNSVQQNGKNVNAIPVMMGLATETGAPHQGHLASFDNRLNAGSGTIRLRAVFDNKDGTLVPGLFARIRLGNPEETKAILITDRAVGTDQNNKFVLVVGADNKTEHRVVKLGGLADGLRIVQDGLKPGEKIIVSGLQRVAMPGQPVAPEEVPMIDEGGQMLEKDAQEPVKK